MAEVIIDEKCYEIDGILFDKDGTLLDFASLWLYWTIDWIDRLRDANRKREVDRSVFAEAVGLKIHDNSWDPTGPLAIGSNDDLTALLAACLYEKGVPWNEAITLAVQSRENAESRTDWEEYVKPTKGLKPFLRKLTAAFVSLGVVTSDDTKRAWEHLEILEIDDQFGSVIGHDAASRGKPFPDMAKEACRQLDIRPEKTLVIGDSNGDMMTGKNAHMLAGIGILPEQIKTSCHLNAADHLIRDYENIKVLNENEEEDF